MKHPWHQERENRQHLPNASARELFHPPVGLLGLAEAPFGEDLLSREGDS